MADMPRYPGTGDENGMEDDRAAPRGTPPWVKVLLVLAVVLVVVLLISIHLMGGGLRGIH